MLTKNDQVTPVEMAPGVVRRTLNYGERTLLAEVSLTKGSIVPAHIHVHEQIGYLASGRIRFRIGDEVQELGPGDSWCVPSNVEHEVWTIEDAIAIDIFSPVREEYKEGAPVALTRSVKQSD